MSFFTEYNEEYTMKLFKEEGREEGSEEATIKHLICLIKKKNFSVEEALTTLDIPEDQWESIKAKLK